MNAQVSVQKDGFLSALGALVKEERQVLAEEQAAEAARQQTILDENRRAYVGSHREVLQAFCRQVLGQELEITDDRGDRVELRPDVQLLVLYTRSHSNAWEPGDTPPKDWELDLASALAGKPSPFEVFIMPSMGWHPRATCFGGGPTFDRNGTMNNPKDGSGGWCGILLNGPEVTPEMARRRIVYFLAEFERFFEGLVEAEAKEALEAPPQKTPAERKAQQDSTWRQRFDLYGPVQWISIAGANVLEFLGWEFDLLWVDKNENSLLVKIYPPETRPDFLQVQHFEDKTEEGRVTEAGAGTLLRQGWRLVCDPLPLGSNGNGKLFAFILSRRRPFSWPEQMPIE